MAVHTISLFAGGAGLDLGFKLACPAARTVCYVEVGIQNAEVLAARIEEGTLDEAPIWSDVRTFDGTAWRGKVDCIIGGFPCQDISVAGKGEGIIEGNRSGLWFEYARIIREVRPSIVFVENVGALLIRGIDRVLGDLADLGYDAEWCRVSAAQCGAPLKRERIFILAHARLQHDEWDQAGRRQEEHRTEHPCGNMAHSNSKRRQQIAGSLPTHEGTQAWPEGQSSRNDIKPSSESSSMEDPTRLGRPGLDGESWGSRRRGVCETGEPVGDTQREGRQEPRLTGWAASAAESGVGLHSGPERPSSDVGNTQGGGMEGDWAGREQEPPAQVGPRLSGRASGIFPPGPTAFDEWNDVLGRYSWLAPAIAEEEVKPDIRFMANGLASLVVQQRTDALRMLGNGVVVVQAADALTILARRAGITL